MNRSIIWERINKLKGIKERLLNDCEAYLEPQLIGLEIHEVKRELRGLADDWEIEGHYIKGHAVLAKVINVLLPNAEKALTQEEKGKFLTHMYQSINALDEIIKKLEEEFPKVKLGF
jgi:transcriptional regulator of heat shock response